MNITKFEKLSEVPFYDGSELVKVTYMGNIIEKQYMSRRNSKATVKMLPGGEQYEVIATGEIKDITHFDSRNDSKKSLYRTFANARGVINANVTDVSKVRWCTLTYAENMTDPEQLYNDFRKFNQRFQWYCKKQGYSKPEYIVMMEPQGRGAWHAHLLYIWLDMNAPFIPNYEFAKLWGHGFVKIKKLDKVENVGAYLTAYLGDMEFEECARATINPFGKECKEAEILDDNGNKVKKCFVKGARLYLYPANFNMLRCSRGVARPSSEMMSEDEATKKVSAATKTFESAVKLVDEDNDFECIIVKQQYNLIKQKSQ